MAGVGVTGTRKDVSSSPAWLWVGPPTAAMSSGVAGERMKRVESRREVAELRFRNSLVGEMSVVVVVDLAGVSKGMRFPFRLERAFGSIDLRRL